MTLSVSESVSQWVTFDFSVSRAERRQSESQERPQTTQKNGRQGRSPTPADDLSPHKGRQKPKEQATAAGPSDG